MLRHLRDIPRKVIPLLIDEPYIASALDWYVASVTFRPLYSRMKRVQYPLDRMVGGPRIKSGRHAEKKNLLSILGILPFLGSTAVTGFTILINLPQLVLLGLQ
jgi:hypothetical protein